MAGDRTAAFGIFENRAEAEEAVGRITAAGFSSQSISVLTSDKEGANEFVATAVGVGGALDSLTGIGAWVIPDVGPFIAAGPIMAALTASGSSVAVGGLVGVLIGLGIPEFEAKVYGGKVKDGALLFSVHCVSDEEAFKASEILTAVGAQDTASCGEELSNMDHEDLLPSPSSAVSASPSPLGIAEEMKLLNEASA